MNSRGIHTVLDLDLALGDDPLVRARMQQHTRCRGARTSSASGVPVRASSAGIASGRRPSSPRHPSMSGMKILLVLVVVQMTVAEPSDAPFELVLGLPLQRLDQLETKFWAIADPQHDDYLQHMSIAEVRKMIGASAADVVAAKSWLKKLGASRCVVSALGDAVVAQFGSEREARASGHWHNWVANPDGVRLPSKANHTRPLHYILRRDPSPRLEPSSGTSCQDALKSSCSTDVSKAHSPFATEACGVCAGRLQHQLRVAGCSTIDIHTYCQGETPRREPYDIVAQKEAYQMPLNLTATNPNTLQMVWGPGTFGFGRGGLEGFRDAHCPLLNVDKVRVEIVASVSKLTWSQNRETDCIPLLPCSAYKMPSVKSFHRCSRRKDTHDVQCKKRAKSG